MELNFTYITITQIYYSSSLFSNVFVTGWKKEARFPIHKKYVTESGTCIQNYSPSTMHKFLCKSILEMKRALYHIAQCPFTTLKRYSLPTVFVTTTNNHANNYKQYCSNVKK